MKTVTNIPVQTNTDAVQPGAEELLGGVLDDDTVAALAEMAEAGPGPIAQVNPHSRQQLSPDCRHDRCWTAGLVGRG